MHFSYAEKVAICVGNDFFSIVIKVTMMMMMMMMMVMFTLANKLVHVRCTFLPFRPISPSEHVLPVGLDVH